MRRVAAAGDCVGELVGAVAELRRHPLAALHDRICHARAGLLELGYDVSAAQGQIEHERVAGVLEGGVHLLDAAGNGVGELVAGLDHEIGHLLRTIVHQIEDRLGFLRETLRHVIEPRRHHVLEVADDLGEFVTDVIGLESQRRGQAVAGGGNRLRGFLAGLLEPVEQVAAAVAERFDHRVAGISERARDVFGLFRERMGDAPRSLVDLLGNEFADLGNVVAEIEVDAVDGVADLAGLTDEGIPLAAQILQQRPDTHLVIVVRVLEGGDLVRHQGLELGGARKRALDAVAHGGDFASNGLADGDDRLARDRLRLRQPHGDLGHRLGDEPQLLGTPRHVGEHVEEDDRHEKGGGEHGQDRCGQAGRSERGLQLRQIEPAEHEAGENPESGEDGGKDIGGAGRTTLQGAQDLPNGFTIVVGRSAQRAGLFRKAQVQVILFEQVLPGRGGRSHGAPRLLRGRRFFGGCERRRGRIAGFRLNGGVPRRERLLDRRKRRFRRIRDLFRGVCHVRRRLVLRWNRAAARSRPRHERVSLEIPSGTPSGSRQ